MSVRIFKDSDAEAREAALAEAVTQKPLHPVEEFEAFADLEKSGFDVPTIARDFALTERRVRQRLALGRLSPRVRRLWREGKISRDLAEVFTMGTIQAQEALLDGCGDQIPPLTPFARRCVASSSKRMRRSRNSFSPSRDAARRRAGECLGHAPAPL